MRARAASGQASTEYVAALAVVVVVFLGVGTAIAAPGVPRTVVREFKHALCVVGGDVCRASDAAARGLPPCVVASNGGSSGRGVTVGLLRLGRSGADMIERRSDGTLRITRSKGTDLSGTVGLEVAAGPLLKLGASGTLGAGYAPGEVWHIDAAAFRELVRRAGPGATRDEIFALLPPPAETFHELSPHAGAEFTAAITLGEDVAVDLGSTGTSQGRELGLRTERDGTRTYYYALHDPQVHGALADLFPDAPAGGDTLVEWRATSPPELTLRIGRPTSATSAEEFVGRLTLSDPAARSAARRAVLAGGVVGAAGLRSLARMVAASGTVERHRYAVDRDAGGADYGVKLGPGLGYDHGREFVVRRLVDAEVLGGPLPVRRVDCLAAAG